MKKIVFLLSMMTALIPAVIAQTKATYVREYCVKVTPGKAAEFSALVSDGVKVMQVPVAEGRMLWWAALESVIPAGTSARCDYLFAYAYEGFPPEPLTRERAEADYRKAKLNMTYSEFIAKRDATGSLVSQELWASRPDARVGANAEKGSYLRMNLYKYKPGHTAAEWIKLETEGWKLYAEELAKQNPGTGWVPVVLTMPSGTSMHYNAKTVDIFPNWTAMGQVAPAGLWSKAHPEMTQADYLAKVAEVIERCKIEVYKVTEIVRKK